jgi:hypothetical protein
MQILIDLVTMLDFWVCIALVALTFHMIPWVKESL